MTVKQIIAGAVACACCFSCASCVKSGVESSQQSSQVSVGEDGVGEIVSPDPSSEEAELGDYRLTANGVKLYYDDTQIPTQVMLALEKYFTSFAARDYEAYKECVFPGYIDSMEEYLQKDYGYGQEQSFNIQCDNLEENVGGPFTVTRIKAAQTGNQSMEGFFTYLNDSFGRDYYKEVAENSDNMYDLFFSIMVDPGDGETLLISDFEIVFAEKDGKFYTFG